MAGVAIDTTANVVTSVLQDRVKATAKQSLRRYSHDDKVVEAGATLVGTVLDAAIESIRKKGDVDVSTIVSVVAKNSASIAGLSEGQKMACYSALFDLAAEGTGSATLISSIAVAEVVTGGMATPVIAMQAALLAKQAADLTNAAIKVQQQCGPLAIRGYSDMKVDFAIFGAEALRQLQNSLMRSVPY